MADIGATIRGILVADSDVSAVVSTRIHSDILPQNPTLPAITYHVVITTGGETLSGVQPLFKARIQVNCHAVTRGAANSLAEKVRLALHMQNRGDNSGQFIHDIALASGEAYLISRLEAGSDQRQFVTFQDFYVTYRPAS